MKRVLSEPARFRSVQRSVQVFAEGHFKFAAIHTLLWSCTPPFQNSRPADQNAGITGQYRVVCQTTDRLLELRSVAVDSRPLTVTCGSVRVHLHSTQNLRQLDSAAVDAALHGAFGYPQEIDDLLVGQLLDVSKNDAFAQVR